MKQFLTLIYLASIAFFTSAQIDTVLVMEQAEELQKSSNLYFWFATASNHRLQFYDFSNDYAEKSNKLLDINDLHSQESDKLRDFNNSIIAANHHIQDINIDNVNGRYPLFTQLMNEGVNDVKIDDANELCIEDALITLGRQLKGSKTIFSLPYFTVIESSYKDTEIHEVIRQVLTMESDHYVVTKHELVDILGAYGDEFSSIDLSTVAKHFNVSLVGVVAVDFIHEVDEIYNNSSSFSEFNSKNGEFIQLAYTEGFKRDVVTKYQNKRIFLGFSLLFFLLLFFVFKGWNGVRWVHYFMSATLISYAVTFLLILALRTLDVTGVNFYLEPTSIIWRVLTASIFSIIPLLITYIGMMKLKFLVEEVNKPSSIIAIIYGVTISSLIFFVSLEVFETGYTAHLYSYILLSIVLFIPALSSGKVTSGLLINHDRLNIIPLVLNLLVIIFVFYSSLIHQSLFDVLNMLWPVLILSLSTYYFDEIINFIKKLVTSDSTTSMESSMDNVSYILPFDFQDKTDISNLFSETVLKINLIFGEKGTGKTRLIHEIEEKSDIIFFFGDCDQETSVINYEPFVEAFASVLGKGSFSDQSAKAKMLGDKLSSSGLLDAIPGGKVINAITSSSGEEIRDHKYIIKEIIEYLKKEEENILIAIDDLHNIDQNSLELLRNLIYEVGVNYNEFNKVSFILTSTESSEEENGNLHFLKELDSNDIIDANILYDNLLESYSNFTVEYLHNLNLEYESEIKITEFLAHSELEYPLHIVEAIKLIDTYKMFDHNGRLSLTKKSDLESLPISKVVSGIYQDKIESLNPDLFTILECAAYIGKTFEANVIVHIIGRDRLEILNMLREAEDLALVVDKSDEDDIYEFTSRSLMKEIRNYGVRTKGGNSDVNVSQIVKEYNDRIINYFFNLPDFDVNELDINLLISLANRSFENNYYRKAYTNRCINLNKVAADRAFDLGKYQDALKMYLNLYKLSTRFSIEDVQMNSLLVMIECYLNVGEINQALEHESELLSFVCPASLEVNRDLLLARLYNNSSRESLSFDLLNKVKKSGQASPANEIKLQLLMAEIYDLREEDDQALEIYSMLLSDVSLKSDTKAIVINKLSNIHFQHGQIQEAFNYAVDGYQISVEDGYVNHQAEFLFELLCISIRMGDVAKFDVHSKEILCLSQTNTVNLKNQLSILLSKLMMFADSKVDFGDLDVDITRLLKMVRYNKDQNKENQVLVYQIIAGVLNDDASKCVSEMIEYLDSDKLGEDMRNQVITTLLYTDVTVMQGEADFKYFDTIDFSIVNEIPTLLPKFNYLKRIKEGENISDAATRYLDEIKGSDICFMIEEFPFSLKLNSDIKINKSILEKYFMAERIDEFINK